MEARRQYNQHLIRWVKNHYWDSLEKDKDLILRHLRTFTGDEVLHPPKQEVEELREALESMVWQFAYHRGGEEPALSTGGLSALESAFAALGWDDPHILTEAEANATLCEVEGCFQESSCGQRWADDRALPYLRLCHDHWRESQNGMPMPAIKQHALDREATRLPDGTLPKESR